MEDHTVGFMKGPAYQEFLKLDLFTTLLEKDPLVYMSHFTFPKSPSQLASARHPTLQILQTSLTSDSVAEDAFSAFKPITDIWKSQDRQFVLAQAEDEGMKDRTIYLVAWKDITEAKSAKQDPSYLEKFMRYKKYWNDIQLFGHITPAYAPPQLSKQSK